MIDFVGVTAMVRAGVEGYYGAVVAGSGLAVGQGSYRVGLGWICSCSRRTDGWEGIKV